MKGLNLTPAKRSPARQALAAAIQARSEARQKVEQMEQARARARTFVDDAKLRLDAAHGSVAALREERATAMSFAAVTGATVPSDNKLRDARLEEAQAADELEAAETALAGLDRRLVFETSQYNHRITTDPVISAGFAVHDAAQAVVNEGVNIANLVGKADAALAAAQTALTDLAVLANDGLIDERHWELFRAVEAGEYRHNVRMLPYVAVYEQNNGDRRLETRCFVPNGYLHWRPANSDPVMAMRIEEWRAMFDRLMSDADTPLPE